MKGRWREKYQQEEWMYRVDISLIYQMEREAETLQQLAKKRSDPRLQQCADRFTLLTATAAGRTVVADLKGERIKRPEGIKNES